LWAAIPTQLEYSIANFTQVRFGTQKIRQFSPSLALVQIDIEVPLFTSLHLTLYRIVLFERDPAIFHTPGLSARADTTFSIAGSVDIFIPITIQFEEVFAYLSSEEG
jgi:hypothetical protein